MSFNQIVWKMAKANYKKYIFYCLCNSFAVMFFFIFSTVYFNDQVVSVKKTESLQYVLTVPGAALIVFTVFFISYAHGIFIKRRKNEFGILMTIGMSNRDISKLLLLENSIIALASLISGVLAGTVFSKLFFLLLMNRVGVQGISFHISGKMFFYTAIIFLAVFFFAVGRSLFFVLRRNVVVNLKSNQAAEIIKLKSPLIGGIGAVIVIGSIIGLYGTYTNPVAGGEYLLLWTLSTMIGLYMAIYQFTSFFMEFAKRNKSFYYRSILILTSLDYKFKQLTSILMLVTVMVMVTILYSTINLFTYMTAEEDAIKENPYDIAFVQTKNKNNLGKEKLQSIVNQQDNPIQKHLVIPVYTLYQKQAYNNFVDVFHFMTLDQFKKLTSTQIDLKDNEFLYYINEDRDHVDGEEYFQENAYSFPEKGNHYSLKKIITQKHINLLADVQDFIILNGSQLKQLLHTLDSANVFESNIHLINVMNWKKSGETAERLEKAFKTYNETTQPVADIRTENRTEATLYQAAFKIEDYEHNKNGNGILFYVTTTLSVIFFFGSFILLYLNLFAEIDKEKEKFKKLHHIGITVREVKQIISREVTILFFLPTIIGTIIAFLFMTAMATDIGGIMENPRIILHFLMVSGIYYVIQIGFCLFARKKMISYVT